VLEVAGRRLQKTDAAAVAVRARDSSTT